VEGVDALLAEIEAQKAKLEELTKTIKDLTGKNAEKTAEVETVTGAMDALKVALDAAKVASSEEAITARIKDRQAVLDAASKVSKDLGDMSAMSLQDVKKAAIAKAAPGIALDGRSPEYVDAVFDTLANGKAPIAGLGQIGSPNASALDGYESPVDKIRRELREKRAKA
jgi:chromosome segregation ATPase